MLIVETHAASHVGRVRKGNEDNYLLLHISDAKKWTSSQDADNFIIESQKFEIDAGGAVFAVSDGMGGALAGEVASQMAVDTVCEKLLDDDPDSTLSPNSYDDTLIGKLYDATVSANYLIHRQGRSDPQYNGMGATFTAVGITPEGVDLVQVGDSRTYLIRKEQIFQLTKDQSLVQQLVDAGQIKPEESETHPMKNVILQALGAQNEIFPVAARLEPQRDDILLICSDGLSNKLIAAEMRKIVLENADKLEKACEMLIKQANENGGEDNITVILAKLVSEDLPAATDEDLKLDLINLGNIHDTDDQGASEIAV